MNSLSVNSSDQAGIKTACGRWIQTLMGTWFDAGKRKAFYETQDSFQKI